MENRRLGALMALSMMTSMAGDVFPASRKCPSRQEESTKLCLECGKPHNHNNSWCSANCCKIYRTKNK